MIDEREQRLLDCFDAIGDLRSWHSCIVLAATLAKDLNGPEHSNVQLLLTDSSARILQALATLEQLVSEDHALWYHQINPVYTPSQLTGRGAIAFSGGKSREHVWSDALHSSTPNAEASDHPPMHTCSRVSPLESLSTWKEATDPPG